MTFGGRQHAVARGSMLRAVVPLGNGSAASWPSFESWSTQGTVWRTPVDADEPCGGLFRVSSYAHAVVRELEPTEPLPLRLITDVRAQLPPNNAHSYGAPPLLLAVTVNASNDRTYLCDVGSTVCLYGEGITVAWVAPDGSFDLGQVAWTNPGAFVVEAAVNVEASRIEEATDSPGWKATTTYVVPANTPAAWQVPLGARAFQASRDSAGAFSTGFLQQLIGDPTSGGPSVELAATRFENGQTLLTAACPNASHLAPPTVAELQVWTVVWDIVP